MRLLICGDRFWKDKDLIKYHVEKLKPQVLIHGGCVGADTLANEVAVELNIPTVIFMADWKRYGRAAGPIRNKQMIDNAHPDFILAFHNNIKKSKGTSNMLRQAERAHINFKLIKS